MTGDGTDRDLTDIKRGIVFALGNGSETTLLLLELIGDAGSESTAEEAVDEGRLLEALDSLEQEGVVVRQTEYREALREPGGGIPEWAEGRAEVVWWDLTNTGKCRLADAVRQRGWP